MAFSEALSSTWTPPPLPRAPIDTETHEDFEFCRIGCSSYRATVTTIERLPYVSISHWWLNKVYASWNPTRKQIFLPKQAWPAFLEQRDRITQAIGRLAEPPSKHQIICFTFLKKNTFFNLSQKKSEERSNIKCVMLTELKKVARPKVGPFVWARPQSTSLEVLDFDKIILTYINSS